MKLERIAIAVLLLLVAGQAMAGCMERRGRRRERLSAANELADRAQQETWYKGQLQVAVRYLHQGQVQLDETQRERDQQAKLAMVFRLEAQELRGKVAAAPAVAGDTARLATEFGDLDSSGFHVRSITAIWPVRAVGPLQGAAAYHVELAPVALQVGFACVGPNARFYVTAPRSRPIVLERGTVAAHVCNPPPPPYQLLSLRAPSLPWSAVLFGAGILAGATIAR